MQILQGNSILLIKLKKHMSKKMQKTKIKESLETVNDRFFNEMKKIFVIYARESSKTRINKNNKKTNETKQTK